MNKNLSVLAFGVGLAVTAWVGAGYFASNLLALCMTLLIAAFYVMGAFELRRFQAATVTLSQALVAIPNELRCLSDWLGSVHPTLQNAVRQRVEGERVALPGPAMTPYLVGLLVLLGMLGTFLGMVVTLNGAVAALESTADVTAIRAALAAPVKGLGVAFGTSVAGVAASAMLGLMSALLRRERQQAAQSLDSEVAGSLRRFSLVHQREETLKSIQQQAQFMPEVVDHLKATLAQWAQQGAALNAQLLAQQDGFHRSAQQAYVDLANSVDQSLRHGLSDSARLTGEVLVSVLKESLMAGAQDARNMQAQVAATVQAQLEVASERFGVSVAAAADHWDTALLGVAEGFDRRTVAVLESVSQSSESSLRAWAEQDAERLRVFTSGMQSAADLQYQQWQEASAQNLALQAQICQTLERTALGMQTQAAQQASSTASEIARLMNAASEAPRAAAELVGQLRQYLSDSMVHDNGVLQERQRITASLSTLLDSVNHAATDQRKAIDSLVVSSSDMLGRLGERFTKSMQDQAEQAVVMSTQIAGSAIEVASWGEAFGHGVQLFSDSSTALIAGLKRIEAALGKSTARSDDQLAYYVAQAREIVELSISSQRDIVDDLQQLASKQLLRASEVA